MINLPEFVIIPRQLIEDKKISLVDERLYGLIYWFTKLKNERCTASNETLAGLLKSTPGTIANSLIRLEKGGYIQRFFKDKKKKNRIEIEPLIVFSRVSPSSESRINDSLSSENDSLSSESGDSLSSEQSNNIPNKNNKEELIKISTKKIFNYYQSQIYSGCRWIDSTREKIGTRLGVYSEEELLKAIDLFSKDSWWMENNSSRGPTWFFNSDHRIEQFLGIKPRVGSGEITKGVYKAKEGLKLDKPIKLTMNNK